MDLDILNNKDTRVYCKGNVAPITGYPIYAGSVTECFAVIAAKQQINPEKIARESRAIYTRVSFRLPELFTPLLVSSEF